MSLIYLTAWLPLGINRAFGALVGRLTYYFSARNRRTALTNLSISMPELGERERRQLVKKHLSHMGQLAMEMGSVWLRGGDWLDKKIVSVSGAETFTARAKDAPGLLLLVPHSGNWEVAGLYASRYVKTAAIYKAPKIPQLEPIMLRGRRLEGADVMPATPRGVMTVFRALDRGDLTMILPDQEPNRDGGEFAPFFGTQALTMTLVPKMIQKTGCEVLIGLAKRVRGGFELIYLEPDSRIYSGDEAEALAGLNASVETVAKMVPEQYQWEYKRFRKRPEGEPKIY